MKPHVTSVALAALLVAAGTGAARAESVFNRIASWSVADNLPQGAKAKQETSAEIISATGDGMTLVYTDSPLGVLGFVDIRDPRKPRAAGVIKLGGEPTSVKVVGGKALVGVNTSKSYKEPGGHLAVVDIGSRKVEAKCDLGGQPDSVAASPDKSIFAVAIENERDEDLNKGALPQLPAGTVAVLTLGAGGTVDCGSMKKVDLTGLAAVAPDDPEPEFVDINANNEIVVTLQENNHIAVIDGKTGKVTGHFSAGSVDLANVDTGEEGALTFAGTLKGVAREPDAVKWLDNDHFVTANEGDYKGGSRGFTVFDKTGKVAYDSGLSLEYAIATIGHYPEKRSGNKGVEPEGLEVATFGGTQYLFVLAERSSVVGVYKVAGNQPELVQMLPSGIAPEGAVAIPARNLLVTANEADLIKDGGVRAHVMIYELAEGKAAYPQLASGMTGKGVPIGWGALSGLAADAEKAGILYAVNDSFYAMQPTIFTIDANQSPAKITRALPVTRHGYPAQKLDQEGIALDGKGGFWIASEGRTDRAVPHAIYNVNAKGEIKKEIGLPPELSSQEIRFGFEGVTTVGSGDAQVLWMAVQREWRDDKKGVVKLVSYTPKTKEWGAVLYPLEKPSKGWMGLSEITAHGDYIYILERDNQIGAATKVKRLYRVALADMKPAKLGGKLPVVKKELVHDFIPDLKKLNGYVVDKIEGFTIDAAGNGYAVTDNDGVDDSSGETLFFAIGKMNGKPMN
jgi:DNA-binding beta-propeller fold protein YncE